MIRVAHYAGWAAGHHGLAAAKTKVRSLDSAPSRWPADGRPDGPARPPRSGPGPHRSPVPGPVCPPSATTRSASPYCSRVNSRWSMTCCRDDYRT